MAQAVLADSKLRIVFQVGVDDDGEPILRAKTFNNVKREATTDQFYQAAEAIISLTSDKSNRIERVDTSDLQAV